MTTKHFSPPTGTRWGLTTADQPNITQVGVLQGLSVSGDISSSGNLQISGNLQAAALTVTGAFVAQTIVGNALPVIRFIESPEE